MLPKNYQARKDLPMYTFLTKYFPDALIELVKVSVAGNIQHNPGEELHWARGKSMDQLNTAMRHQFDHGMGDVFDEEPEEVQKAIGGNTMHLAKAAWRLLAEIQLIKEQHRIKKPLAFNIDAECNVEGRPLGDRLVGYDRGSAGGKESNTCNSQVEKADAYLRRRNSDRVAQEVTGAVPSLCRQIFDPQG